MSPLFEFASDELQIDPTIWYKAKVALTIGLLRKAGSLEQQTSPPEVVNETLIRINLSAKGYVRQPDETLDTYMLRCLRRTISSLRAKQVTALRRRKFDDPLRSEFYGETDTPVNQAEQSLALAQAQASLVKALDGTRTGKALKRYASKVRDYAMLGLNSSEIAALEGASVASVDKNRQRLAAIVKAQIPQGEVSK